MKLVRVMPESAANLPIPFNHCIRVVGYLRESPSTLTESILIHPTETYHLKFTHNGITSTLHSFSTPQEIKIFLEGLPVHEMDVCIVVVNPEE